MFYSDFKNEKQPLVELGVDQPFVLSKLFGPTVFQDLRITAVLEQGGWVIERMTNKGWAHWVTIPAQIVSTDNYTNDED